MTIASVSPVSGGWGWWVTEAEGLERGGGVLGYPDTSQPPSAAGQKINNYTLIWKNILGQLSHPWRAGCCKPFRRRRLDGVLIWNCR